MAKAADVDWDLYFYKIRQWCPWSYAAWQRKEIEIQNWQGKVIDLGHLQARVYLVKSLNHRRLKKLCKQLDYGEYEWLWSHPGYGANSTPVFCLIQQDRKQLNSIRAKLREK